MSGQALDRDTVESKLEAYLIENANVPVGDNIPPEENLLDSGILDSLGIAEITEFMETEFSITIDEDEIFAANYGSLRKLTDFCSSKLGSVTA